MSKDVTIKIKGDSKEYKATLNDVKKDTNKLSTSSLKASVGLAGMAGAVVAIGAALKGAVTEAAKFEDIGVQFEVLTGSVDKANDALNQLKEFSAGTPFQFEEIANAGKLLLSFGEDVSMMRTRLQEIGDVSAATGTDLQALATIYGQVSAAGRLTGERLNQLQERSINIAPAIAKVFKVQEHEVRELVSKGLVSAEKFKEAFTSLSEEGGIAFGGLEKKSKTLNGKISTLTDNWKLLTAEVGNRFLPVAKRAVSAFTNLIKAITPKTASRENSVKMLSADLEEMQEKLKKATTKYEAFKKTRGADDNYVQTLEREKIALEAQLAPYQSLIDSENKLKVAKAQAEADDKAKAEAKKARMAEEQANAQAEVDAYIQKNEAKLESDRAYAEAELEGVDQKLELEKVRQEELNLAKEEGRLTDLVNKKKYAEASVKIEEGQTKKTLKELQQRQKAEQMYAQAKVTVLANTAALATTILGQENKFAFGLTKAAAMAQAIVNTAQGVTAALALGPIAGPPLATTIKIAGGIQMATIAASAIQGFENGGVIGGFQGASVGGDNRMATVRDGEMVLNAGQQKNLFEAINSGSLGGGGEVELTVRVVPDEKRFFKAMEKQVIASRANGTGRI